jgi:hypothetical protein
MENFGTDDFLKVYARMQNNLNISRITVTGTKEMTCEYPYRLDDDNWKKIQMDYLKVGYESRGVR